MLVELRSRDTTIKLFQAALFFAAVAVQAQAPLTIDGVTDKSTYTDSVSLRVPSADGYTYSVQLDGDPIPTDASIAVNRMDYHELAVSRTNTTTGAVATNLVRFILISSERGSPEKGLIKWTPYPPINSTAAEFAGAQLHLMTPQNYPMGLPIPVIARVDDGQDRALRANGWINAPGFDAIQILRGHGSGFLPPATHGGALVYDAQLTTLQAPKQIIVEDTTAWTPVSGVLSGTTTWPENSRVFLTANITIPANASLTVGAGTVVKLNPLVNITNSGLMVVNGTVDRPVVFTGTNVVWPEVHAGAWGGFLMRGSSATLVANGTIFAGGGGATSFDFSPGSSHKSEQAVLLIHSGAHAYLTNCAIINSAGQVGNGYNCDYSADHCLFQRAITGGEYAGSSSVVAINHSAMLEFPNDDGVVDSDIADADYDGIYFTEGTHILMNSLFGFAKDDAIDSGSGGAGTMWVSNCWVESALHEAHAWSGGGRVARSFDTVLINSGQGIENGWSTGNGSPLCFADHLLTTGNSVGARVGDNYDWNYTGTLTLTNSLILNNYRDVFLKTWNSVKTGLDTNSWVDRVLQVDFRGNQATTVDARFPGNLPWNPAIDGWQLAHWMTTPPDAPVGIGLGVRTNRFAMASLFSGIPVRLSSFTTNFVSVDYTFVTTNGPLAEGTLTFAPGETVKSIYPAGFDAAAQSQVEVVLSNPVRGELTGRTNLLFTGIVAAPQIALTVTTNRCSSWRLAEGVFVSLTAPSAMPVNVDYAFESLTGPVSSGTLVFNPLEIRRQIYLTGGNLFDYDLLTLTVSNPTNAALTGITRVTYASSNAPLTLALALTSNPANLDGFGTGVPVTLSGPATISGVSVDFQIEGNGGAVTNGTLSFGVGEVTRLILAPTINPAQHDLIKVTLLNPVKAALSGPTTGYYVRTPATPTTDPVTLVDRGNRSLWSYNDTGIYPGANWMTTSFDDSAWPTGGAPLGYNDSGVPMTTTNSYGPSSSSKHIAYYYRHYFNVTNAASLSAVTFNLLRDDGAVVYLNGTNIYRENMPATLTQTTTASTNVGGASTIYRATTFDAKALPLLEGPNVVAVEIHQNNAGSSDIVLDLEIIATPTPLPPSPQPLYYGRFESGLTLVWSDDSFELLQAANVTGPWTTNSASGVFDASPTNSQSFFKLRSP